MTEETKSAAEALIPQFEFERLLNQGRDTLLNFTRPLIDKALTDQNGRRIALYGSIAGSPAVMTVERAAFATDPAVVSAFLRSISGTTNLGVNDVYRWSESCQFYYR